MENSARFDLNEAIRQWRKGLSSSPALSTRELQELESHLRDSTMVLQTQGFTPAEAFRIASQRLGRAQELADEFEKLNPQRVWMDRAFWMVAGIVVSGLIGWSAAIARETIMHQMLARSNNAHLTAIVGISIQWFIMLGAIAVFWHLANHGNRVLAQMGRLCIRRPLLPLLGLMTLCYTKIPLFMWLVGATSPVRPEMVERIQQMRRSMTVWWQVDWWAHFLFWIFLLIYLGGRQLRHRGSMEISNAADIREVWFKRGTWMVAGQYLNTYFLSDLGFSAQSIIVALAQRWQGNGHLFGLLSAFILWAVVVGAVCLLWRLFARDETAGRRIVLFGLSRPALGAPMLLFCTSLAVILQKLFPSMAQIPGTPGLSSKGFQVMLVWNDHAQYLLYDVVPLFLLFWLARKLWDFQTASTEVSTST